ncbi:hypothetical protein LPJ74_000134 [Coemansia sp. RSA 1843]|nr:hypothetical protein LPJ74_000134 [Coemansia sp. RSA 1843]
MSFSYYIEVLDSLGIVDIYVGSAVGKQNDYCSSGASEDIAGLVDESTVNINDTTTVHLPASVLINQTISVSLSQVFCREMLSHASAHAVYKFVVESREACTPVAIVHLVGWNAEIQAGSSHAGGMDAFEKCAKVLFTKAGDGEFQSRANKSLEDDTTELLSLLEDDCNKLVLLLTQNSRFIPPQLRAMAGLTRSFLQM